MTESGRQTSGPRAAHEAQRPSSLGWGPGQAWKPVSTLPNPFIFLDGSLVASPQDWLRRRQELATLAEYYVFGCVQTPDAVSYQINPSNVHDCTIIMQHEGRTAGFHMTVHIPTHGHDTSITGPYPAFIFIGMPAASAQKAALSQRGYAVIEMAASPIYSDDATRSGAYTTLWPYQAQDTLSDSGALRAWAWGVSRILDVLALGAYPEINRAQTIVTGVSRYGKAALLAAAFDARIAIAVPVDTGQAGASSFRYNVEGRLYHDAGHPFAAGMGRSEKISNMMGGLSHWFSSRITEFVDREAWLPFDSHSILALVAPRPLFVFAGEEFDWLCAPSTVLSCTAAQEVYEFLGAGDAIALNVRKGPHAIQDRDIALAMDFADRALRGLDPRWSKHHFPFPDPYHAHGDVVDSEYIPWSRPGKHELRTNQEQFLAGQPTELTVHSDARTITLEPPATWQSPRTPIVAPVRDGTAIFHLNADQAKPGTYILTAEGPKDCKHVEILGITWDQAVQTSLSRDGTGRIIHFGDRYDQSRVRVWVNGTDITDVSDPLRFPDEQHRQVYLMNYGIRLCNVSELPPDSQGCLQVEIRQLQFRHLWPDHTFRLVYTIHTESRERIQSKEPLCYSSGIATGLTVES